MAQERAHLEEEKKKFPHLFPENTWVDDRPILETLGIHIPGKEILPRGFLKIMPSDFLVEEISENGTQTDISVNNTTVPDEVGSTIYATLVKCGLSTLEAVEELAKLFGTTKDKIQYAGIKDKDAITSQQISVRGISKEQVLSVSSPHFLLKEIHTGKGVIQKGGLKGNRFSILIRIGEDLFNKGKINAALEGLKKVRAEGFYNFFYLQRFGAPRLNNYKWGISILKGDYEGAIRGLISDPGLRELPYFLEKRQEIIRPAPDWSAVLERLREFPLTFPSEIKVVEHLANRPIDFAGALQKIEEQVTLWVSAVASLLYNRKISAHLLAGIKPPQTLPLFLSPDKNDWLPYAEDLADVGISPPNFNNLRPFRSVAIRHRDIKTKDMAEIHATEVIPEGIVIEFSLGKGEYATTFLSHFVNLMSGKVPSDIKGELVDVKLALGERPITETLKYFEKLNVSKKDRE